MLYRKQGEDFEVTYIGVAGLSVGGTSGICSRIKSHARHKKGWTHYSVFEVHDNVTREEVRELEALLLGIFRDDRRIGLVNMQLGSKAPKRIRVGAEWNEQRRARNAKCRWQRASWSVHARFDRCSTLRAQIGLLGEGRRVEMLRLELP